MKATLPWRCHSRSCWALRRIIKARGRGPGSRNSDFCVLIRNNKKIVIYPEKNGEAPGQGASPLAYELDEQQAGEPKRI